MPDFSLINPDGSQKLPFAAGGSMRRPAGVLAADPVAAGSGSIGPVETRAAHPRSPLRVEIPLVAVGGPEIDVLIDMLAGTSWGLLPLRWSPPWEPRLTPETAPRWRLLNGSALSLDLARARAGISVDVSLTFEEV